MADDSEDENAEAHHAVEKQLMRAGGTPLNKDLMSWLKGQLPKQVYESLQTEAQRVQWSFLCPRRLVGSSFRGAHA